MYRSELFSFLGKKDYKFSLTKCGYLCGSAPVECTLDLSLLAGSNYTTVMTDLFRGCFITMLSFNYIFK